MTMAKYSKDNLLNDPSLWSLLFSNLITIFFAITENWNLPTVILVYWFQTIIIGFFNFIRILQLKKFSTEGFNINNQPAQPTQGMKIVTAFFFLFHYGFFHLIYLSFFIKDLSPNTHQDVLNSMELKYILLTALLFFVNHLFSYLYNRPKDTKKQNIGSLMFYPYARIIPMHLTITLGSLFGNMLLFFLILKTFADILMHIIEHNILKKGEEQPI